MPRCLPAIVVLIAWTFSAAVASPPGEAEARDAVRTFGKALTRSDAALIRPLLPRRGKVQLRLMRLGPEEGYFSASQVEAVLRGFLAQGAVRSFDLVRLEHETDGYALAEARLTGTDRQGRPARVGLTLSFREEGGAWVLSEIRESPP